LQQNVSKQVTGFINSHCHSEYSNKRLIDCINKVQDLLETASKLNYSGIAITDHESLSAHVKAIQITRELKKSGKLSQDFKLILGNEIYLVDSVEEVRDNYQSKVTKFPHFLLLSKNAEGHALLRKLSSKAWENRFVTGLMERVPISKREVEEIIGENKGHLIASTACLGSELAIKCLELHQHEANNDTESIIKTKKEIHDFINWCINTFQKDNFFIELQPALSEEQMIYNRKALTIAEAYNLKTIVTTDAHFLRPEDMQIHRAFLNSKDEDRETESFYEACFLQTIDEIIDRLTHNGNLTREVAIESINNTMFLREMVEDYDLKRETVVPKIDLPNFQLRHLFQKAYDKYKYIEKLAYSEHEQDRYLLKLVEDGFLEKIPYKTITSDKFHEMLARIDIEFEELWHISEKMNDQLSAYYVTMRDIILMIWDDECGGNSIVGVGRGSAVGFFINYLLDITQLNPIEFNLPHWRHLHKSRPEFPDIDIDTEASKRQRILNALKNKFGYRQVLNICTFRTEKSKKAIQTSCRGLGIDVDIAQYLSQLIPFERGESWTISDCLYGNEEKGRLPIAEFIREINKYPRLKETALKIEGLISGRGIHASGIYIFNNDFTELNAMMTSPKGQWTTQFSMEDSDYMGGQKYDFLTVENQDKLRATLEFLMKDGVIEYQGSLKKTYDKYIHPDTLDLNNEKMWEVATNSEMIDLFQFNTPVGMVAIKKVKPRSVAEMSVANSLMRLMAEDGQEQPVDTYEKYRNNISLWYDEMRSFGLNNDEIAVFEKHLKHKYGIADSQESVMLLSMDKKIANFDVASANGLRKGIAKKKKQVIDEVKKKFYEWGYKNGTSKSVLDYTWEVQIKRQLGYSFSDLHNYAYTIIALQGIKLYITYDPIYWNTAVLTVNAASNDEDEYEELNEALDESFNSQASSTSNKGKSTDYGKVASAIGAIRSHGVKVSLPYVNSADFGFKPDVKNQQIVFGLKGMIGIGDDAANLIIDNRPYESFNHFLEKCYLKDPNNPNKETLKNTHMIQLIKAGSFDEFGDRVEIMNQFLNLLHEPKKELNMRNFDGLCKANLIPSEFEQLKRHSNFRKYLNDKCVLSSVNGKKKVYQLTDDYSKNYFLTHFSNVQHNYESDNSITFEEKHFEKVYKSLMEPVRAYVSDDKTLASYNDYLFKELWDKHATGSISKWEMDSLCFYYNEHELAHVNRDKYKISNFFELPEEPEIEQHMIFKNSTRPKFKLTGIVGTVIHKDKNKHTITLLTPEGVVIVKYYDGAFAHYNKNISRIRPDGTKETLEKSWFTRGSLLYVQGYRRGSQFKPQKYNDSFSQHTTLLITHIDKDGNLTVRDERVNL